MSCKVIVTGAVNGDFEIFHKLSRLHEKNAFSLALIAGDLFRNPESHSEKNENDLEALLNGTLNIPLPTYFTLSKYPLPPRVQSKLELSDGELCTNLYFLGKRSVTKTSEGLRLVTLGGLRNPELTAGLSKDRFTPFYTAGDAKSLYGAHNADILVTYPWPSAVRSGSRVELPGDASEPHSESSVADLCSTLEPRYHFAVSGDFFFEREPFFHLTEDNTSDTPRVTRFINLATYGNAAKHKWLYAFSIDPSSSQNLAIPGGATASPFSRSKRKFFGSAVQEDGHYRFSREEPYTLSHRSSKRAKTRGPPPGPESCFFCLSNPNLAAHLITSISNDSYLTTAKGPLPTHRTFSSLGFPGHMLIIPLSHASTFASISPAGTKMSTYEEMSRYRRALQRLVASTSDGSLGAVTWEISRDEGIHLHWQFLPLPAELVSKGLAEAAFRVEAENERYESFQAKDIGDGSGLGSDFLRLWIWRAAQDSAVSPPGNAEAIEQADKIEEKQLILEIKPGSRFDLQFPRKVMAKLLGLEKRSHWKDCPQSEAEEAAEAEAFKSAFKPFDVS